MFEALLTDGAATIDSSTQRFGFRESWAVGKHIILNGSRINLFGENISYFVVAYPPAYSSLKYSEMPGIVELDG